MYVTVLKTVHAISGILQAAQSARLRLGG